MNFQSKIKFACFFTFSIISVGLLIQNGFFMLENRDVSYREKLLTELSTKIGKSHAIQKRLYEELPELEEKHAALKEGVSQHLAEVRSLEENQKKLANENQQLSQSNQQLRVEISEAQNKKNAADTALKTVRLELNSKMEELRSKDSEMSQLNALQEFNKGLQKKQVEYEIHCKGLQAQSEQLKEKIAKQQKELGDFKSINLDLEVLKNEIQNLEQKKQLLAKELRDTRTQLSELTTQKKNIQDELINQRSALTVLQDQSKGLKETILQQKQLAGRLDQVESTLSARRMDLGKLEEEHQINLSKYAVEIKNSNQKVLDLEAISLREKQTLNDLKKQVALQQKASADLEKINLDLEASKNEIRNLQQKKQLLAKELRDTRTELKELTTQKKDIQDELINQRSALAFLQDQSKGLKETILQQKQVAGRLDQLESTLMAKRMDLGKLEEEHQINLSKYAVEIKNSNQKILDLERIISNEKQTLDKLKKQIEQQQTELESLKTVCHELEVRKSKLTQNS